MRERVRLCQAVLEVTAAQQAYMLACICMGVPRHGTGMTWCGAVSWLACFRLDYHQHKCGCRERLQQSSEAKPPGSDYPRPAATAASTTFVNTLKMLPIRGNAVSKTLLLRAVQRTACSIWLQPCTPESTESGST